MNTSEALMKSAKQRGQIHWFFLAAIGIGTIIGDFYFPAWRLAIVATIMPAGFAVICGRKLYRRVGYWLLITILTILFWMLNARLRFWMNEIGGILSLAIIGVAEMIAIMAVVVRVYPEAKKG